MKFRGLALLGVFALTAQTPPPTSSSECPSPALATRTFLAAGAAAVRAPKGALSLVAVSDEPSRERGLMCVVRLPPGKGMIFAFPGGDAKRDFWMKNTLIMLDMVWVAADGRVTGVAANIPPTPNGTPDSQIAHRDGVGTYVIELGGGDAARHGIKPGVKLVLPPLSATP